MTTISDLPTDAVKHITQLARGRVIDGVNSYARVNRQWYDAGSSEGSEQLQLFLDLEDMSEAAIERALGWLATHGKQAGVLVIAGELAKSMAPDLLYTSVAALSNLRRLEVGQQHSLVRLAPVLGQLPQLQHLEAAVAMVCHPAEVAYLKEEGDGGQGMFVDQAGELWVDLPDLQQQLCPQLTHLRLLIDPGATGLWIDEGLPLLLAPRLRQLELVGLQDCRYSWIQSRLLSHLTSLQQLTLKRVDLGVEHSRGGLDSLQQDLSSLQQLRVLDPRQTLATNKALAHISLKLRDYNSRPFTIRVASVAGLVALTRLELQGEMPARVTALGNLKLQELSMVASGSESLVKAARLARRVPTLRSLQLRSAGFVEPWAEEDVSNCLEECTQLTSLHLAVSMSYTSDPPFLLVPEQLTGLRCLTVPAQLLEQEEGDWLAPFTALTRLCLNMPKHMAHRVYRVPEVAEGQVEGRPDWVLKWLPIQLTVMPPPAPMGITAVVEELLQEVEEWPASLQQVVVFVKGNGTGAKRMCWQHTPAVPAGGAVSVWVEQQEGKAAGWARPLRPCPHLPGVWELQGQVQSSSSDLD